MTAKHKIVLELELELFDEVTAEVVAEEIMSLLGDDLVSLEIISREAVAE
jgi:hypothetical protein